jgi:hypothetical protein
VIGMRSTQRLAHQVSSHSSQARQPSAVCAPKWSTTSTDTGGRTGTRLCGVGGHLDTSAVEGTHAKLKRWLANSQGDLLTVFQQLLPWWATTIDTVNFKIAREKVFAPYMLQHDTYSAVVRIISVWALTETDKQLEKARTIVFSGGTPQPCSGRFRSAHGQPCVHELMTVFTQGVKILPERFARHWWLSLRQATLPSRVYKPANARTSHLPSNTAL